MVGKYTLRFIQGDFKMDISNTAAPPCFLGTFVMCEYQEARKSSGGGSVCPDEYIYIERRATCGPTL